MRTLFSIITFVFLFASVSNAQTSGTMIKDVTVIQLVQTPGQYETRALDLTPGKYVFEVTNQNVDKSLGFYLTPTSDAKAQVPNSGLSSLVAKGETARTGVVTLSAGEFQYSCPLNPTPQYKIKVSDKM